MALPGVVDAAKPQQWVGSAGKVRRGNARFLNAVARPENFTLLRSLGIEVSRDGGRDGDGGCFVVVVGKRGIGTSIGCMLDVRPDGAFY